MALEWLVSLSFIVCFLCKSGRSSSHVHIDSYLQPQPQGYTGNQSSTFPASHGQAASFFMATGVQQEFAFIPDDFSGTYVVNVESNTTRTLPPPTTKDTKSSYVASITSLVQLDSAGAVSFMPYVPGDSSTDSSTTWSSVKALAALPLPSSSTSGSNPQVTGNTYSGKNGTSEPAKDGASSTHTVTSGLVGLAVLFAILGFL